VNEYIETNRLHWDDSVPIHVASQFYNVAAFKAGESKLLPVERAEVGDVSGKTLLHLQCHFGLDTLSWAREGATVTGVDYSRAGIEAAKALAAETGITARFIESNIYDLPSVLQEKFDIVFTSYGVLPWLPDINEWARVAAHHVKPGGTFYIVEHHPLLGVLGEQDVPNLSHAFGHGYFAAGRAFAYEEDGTYADPKAKLEHPKAYEFQYTLGEIISAIAASGLRIEFVHEFPIMASARFGSMQRAADGYYRLPSDLDGLVPLLFSIKAQLPA
jgi:2-polyprenyl-3-methyl-5-hydroxy-6-metoxy-1,4-benzoquinol methylase